jgi:NADH-quinone oxidoreductase subunit J
MAEKPAKVIRAVFELAVLLLALGVIFGGLALIVLFSPWSQTVLSKLLSYDVRFGIELLAFLTIAALIVLLSALVVYSKNIVHSALYLLGSFAGVATLYIFLNAPFVGVAQVLVYIGAVGVLLLFAVMLTRKTMVNYKTVILSLAFLAALFASLSIAPWGQVEQQPYTFEPREGLRMPESGVGDIGTEIFTIYVFPFEVLALVLTAALVGAIYIARKEAA